MVVSPFNAVKDARVFLFPAAPTTLYLVGKQGPARFSGFPYCGTRAAVLKGDTVGFSGVFFVTLKGGMMAAVESKENAILLAERDGGWFCHYCGMPVGLLEEVGHPYERDGRIWYTTSDDSPVQLFSIDHKIPKSKGGPDSLDNLLLTCRKCNQRKGKKDYDSFVQWLAKFIKG